MALILLVEDEPSIADMLALLLEDEGNAVLVACDGKAALDVLTHAIPAIIVSDVMMRRMDGLAFYRAIRADPALHHIPVILVSAALLPPPDLASMGAAFQVKPIDIEPFLRLVHDLLP